MCLSCLISQQMYTNVGRSKPASLCGVQLAWTRHLRGFLFTFLFLRGNNGKLMLILTKVRRLSRLSCPILPLSPYSGARSDLTRITFPKALVAENTCAVDQDNCVRSTWSSAGACNEPRAKTLQPSNHRPQRGARLL